MRGGGLSERKKKVKSFRACFLCKTKVSFVENAWKEGVFGGFVELVFPQLS